MVTVLVPTANRPALLRTALASIVRQTAAAQVSRVVVSENSGNRESETVCREFPTLPITYVFRRPTDTLQHASDLMRDQLAGDFIAILHDDDWWAPHHLGQALGQLASQPESVASTASHLTAQSESSLIGCHDNAFAWFGSSYAPLDQVWVLSRLNVLMAQLLGTVAHYSSVVVRTEVLRACAFVYDMNNPFDNDRMLLFALSMHGSVVFNPAPSIFVRHHAAQDCNAYDRALRDGHLCATTRWMLETCGQAPRAIAAAFARRLANCPQVARARLDELAAKPWSRAELTRLVRASNAPPEPAPV